MFTIFIINLFLLIISKNFEISKYFQLNIKRLAISLNLLTKNVVIC